MFSFTLYDFIVAIYSFESKKWSWESLWFFFGIVNKCADTIKIHLYSVVVVAMTNVDAAQVYHCVYFPFLMCHVHKTRRQSFIVGGYSKLKILIFSMAWPFQMITCKHNIEMCSNPTADEHIIYFHFSRHQETKTIPANLLLFSFRLLFFLLFERSKNSVFKWVNIFALQCAVNWNFCLKCAHISTHQCTSSITNSIYRLIKSRMPFYTHKYENALENLLLLIHELLFFYIYVHILYLLDSACVCIDADCISIVSFALSLSFPVLIRLCFVVFFCCRCCFGCSENTKTKRCCTWKWPAFLVEQNKNQQRIYLDFRFSVTSVR